MTQDVTEVAEARDAALAAAEAKAQFLANMSHEIRTPMNGVLGVLHLLKSEPVSADGRRLLDEAVGCGHMLSELLNDVIDFSKIEAGRLELSPEPVDPAAVLRSVTDLLRPQAAAAGLWLNVEADDDLGWRALDPVRLRQILFNLIGNAVKFTPAGGVDVRLSGCLRDDAPALRFEVMDTGVGISEEAQASLFQRFHQADGSTTRRFGGSGLGLAISRRLAELLGGEIGLRSQPGVGSVFTVEMLAPPASRPQVTDGEGGEMLEGLRVLVVEDNPTNRLIATRLLEHLGAQVETADDGRMGVDAVARASFDLIFMDIQMPGMDGVQATRLIRAMPGPASTTPILAMTANALQHQTDAYLAAGMNGVVSKPLSPGSLIARIAAVLPDGDSDVAAA
jgi:CheY-like chemotaxis protein